MILILKIKGFVMGYLLGDKKLQKMPKVLYSFNNSFVIRVDL